MAKKECKCNGDPFVGIAAVLGGILLVMVLFLALFAQSQISTVIPVSFCFMVMAIALGYYASKSRN